MDKCLNCEKSFDKIQKVQKYCSKRCKTIQAARRYRMNKKDNIEYKNRQKLHYEKNKDKKKEYLKKPEIVARQKRYMKNWYNDNIEKVKLKKRKRGKITQIGQNIKKYILNLPDKYQRCLWDGIGIWSKEHNYCKNCKTNIYMHKAKGLCEICYERKQRQQADPIKKKWAKLKRRISAQQKKSYDKEYCSKKKKEAELWINKALKNEIKIDNKVSNLLNNLGMILDS